MIKIVFRERSIHINNVYFYLCLTDLSTYIYLLDQDSNFLKFNPLTFDVKFIGKVNCSTTAYPYSLALQRDGKAWTLFTDGSLYTFDTKTALCQATSYLSQQEGLILFGMKFILDKSSNTEKLYISSDSSNLPYRLATIDVATLKVSIIGYYNNIIGRGELTSSYDERLFGLFEGTPYIVAEINQTNAEILSKTSLDMIQYTPDSSYFAFESYLSNFFLFVGDNTYTDIFLYDLSSKSITKKKTIPNGIVGAGISTYTRGI